MAAEYLPANLSERVQARLLSQVGANIKDILDSTRENVQLHIAEGMAAGDGAAQLGDRVEQAGAFSELRAETIARTETATLLNRAAMASYREFGVTHVEVIDGDDDEECAAANGQTWTLEEAEANPIEHPNCVRDFSPIIGEPAETPEEAAPAEDQAAPAEAVAPVEAPPGVEDIQAATSRFDEAGGTIETVSAGFRNSAELRTEFGEMASVMPEGWAMEAGPHATRSVFNIQGSTQMYQVARDGEGALAGAMKLSPPSFLNPEALEISLVGSTGIAPGAGSAMTREAIRQAAEQGVGIRLTPLTDAKPFWTRMGLGEGNADNGGWGATAEQIKRMWEALK